MVVGVCVLRRPASAADRRKQQLDRAGQKVLHVRIGPNHRGPSGGHGEKIPRGIADWANSRANHRRRLLNFFHLHSAIGHGDPDNALHR